MKVENNLTEDAVECSRDDPLSEARELLDPPEKLMKAVREINDALEEWPADIGNMIATLRSAKQLSGSTRSGRPKISSNFGKEEPTMKTDEPPRKASGSDTNGQLR